MSNAPRQTRFVFIHMNMSAPSSSRPSWWHAAKTASKSAAIQRVMDVFSYHGKLEAEVTDEVAVEVMAWAKSIPGFRNDIYVEVWENGRKLSGDVS